MDKDKNDNEIIEDNGKNNTFERVNYKINNEIIKGNARDDAGPSTANDLPGSIDSPNVLIKGVSKSEHSIRQITYQNVSNALRLTSFSFGPVNLTEKTRIPANQNDTEHVTLTELNEFVISCYKVTEESNIPQKTVPSTGKTPNLENDANENDMTHLINQVAFPPKPDPKEQKPVVNKKKNSSGLSAKSDFGVGQKDSLSSIGSNVCRICMTKGRERMISPCNCKGSLANVHLTCLERWLNQVGRNHCELCGYSYPAIRTPRYTVLQALRLWFGNPRNRGHLQSDCLIFWLLSTVTAGLLAVCVVGTQYFVFEGTNYGKRGRKTEGIPHRITETAMDFFMAIVLCGYSVTVYLLWKDHFVMWNRWRRANVNVRLLLTPDSNPVPFVPRSRYSIV